MKKNEFKNIDGRKVNLMNLLIVMIGVLAITITGYCYLNKIQARSDLTKNITIESSIERTT